jgi:hypothetical protein
MLISGDIWDVATRGSSVIFHHQVDSCMDPLQYSYLKITVQKYKYHQTGFFFVNALSTVNILQVDKAEV